MVGSEGKKGFGWHVVHLLKPKLKEAGFRPCGSSRIWYERDLGRGLLEWVLWVCHQWGGEFHIQYAVKHLGRFSNIGGRDEFSCGDSLYGYTYTDEEGMCRALERSFSEWKREREKSVPEMEHFLRTNRTAKKLRTQWHGWWKEFGEGRAQTLEELKAFFPDVAKERVEGAWEFAHEDATGGSSRSFWLTFAVLKVVQKNPRKFKGHWWTVAVDAPRCWWFHDRLGDLDALLEPFDV